MKIRGSVVSLSFILPHPSEDKKKKVNNKGHLARGNYYQLYNWYEFKRRNIPHRKG